MFKVVVNKSSNQMFNNTLVSSLNNAEHAYIVKGLVKLKRWVDQYIKSQDRKSEMFIWNTP